MKRQSWILLLLGTFLLLGILPAEGASSFKVIVNASNPDFADATWVDKGRLSQMFLKKVMEWERGEMVLAVDQGANTPIREDFSREVHGKSVPAIQSYWQRQIFSGRSIPPPEKATDQEVMAFVRANRNAIGYVSSTAQVANGVKVLEVREE